MPIFSILGLDENPLQSRSTTNAVTRPFTFA